MSADKFIPMYNLESLTEEEKAVYYKNACAYYGVPADLNFLAFIFMDSGYGYRNEVLYAKKGATDHIRDERGITTVDLIGPVVVGGSVVFTAVGKDKKERVERAAGAAAIEGLHGQALAAAIMTAQTRATRRMTLQFVGGLLDESEVHSATTSIASAGMPLAKIAALPPTPNNAPGKMLDLFPAVSTAVDDISSKQIQEVKTVATAANPAAEPEATDTQKAALEALGRVNKEVLALAAGEPVKTAEQPGERTATAIDSAPKQRRKRKVHEAPYDLSPNADTAAKSPSADTQLTREAFFDQEPHSGFKFIEVPDTHVCPGGDHQVCTDAALANMQKASQIETPQPVVANLPEREGAKPVEPPTPPTPKPGLPSADQQKVYRARWSEYVNRRLSKEGKMVPTEGVGGVSTKLQKFVLHLLPGVKMGESLTVEQWETVLNYLDDKYETVGAEALVTFVDGVVTK